MLSIVTDLVKIMKDLGYSIQQIGESFYALAQADGKEKLKRIAQIIVESGNKVLSLAEMIALGKYDRVNSDITVENFPVDPVARWDEETRHFHFDKDMSTEAVKAEMAKEGWKPGRSQLFSFFRPIWGGESLFLDFVMPAAEHSSDFVRVGGNCSKFRIIKCLDFPGNL